MGLDNYFRGYDWQCGCVSSTARGLAGLCREKRGLSHPNNVLFGNDLVPIVITPIYHTKFFPLTVLTFDLLRETLFHPSIRRQLAQWSRVVRATCQKNNCSAPMSRPRTSLLGFPLVNSSDLESDVQRALSCTMSSQWKVLCLVEQPRVPRLRGLDRCGARGCALTCQGGVMSVEGSQSQRCRLEKEKRKRAVKYPIGTNDHQPARIHTLAAASLSLWPSCLSHRVASYYK